MKLLIAALSAVLLSGCSTVPTVIDNPVVIKYKYVIVTIPQELLEVPVTERKLDTSTATDKDTAKWMIDWERRYQEIEIRLKTIKSYQDKRVSELTIPASDIINN